MGAGKVSVDASAIGGTALFSAPIVELVSGPIDCGSTAYGLSPGTNVPSMASQRFALRI